MALPLVFFFSGTLALVYEVLWQRRFALVFGSGAPAMAAVLAAYFAGLGAGSAALGAAGTKWRPLRAYAVMEVLIGVGALLVAPLSDGSERLLHGLVEGGGPGARFAVRTALAFLSLALPTFCMGGTLPVLAQVIDRGRRRLGINAGLLYAANTAGAGLGALSVPLLLLPALGATGTLRVCVLGNLVLAAVAWRMDRHAAIPRASAPRTGAISWTHPAVVLSLVSGLATFTLQVLWNRAFAQVHESSVYSFALIVAVFVLALAAGAQAARVALRREVAPGRLLGWAWLLGGALAAAGPWLFLRLTHGLVYLPAGGGWSTYALRLALVAGAVLLPPVALIGIGLPALMEQAGRESGGSTSDALGRLLAANVAGCVAGALLAGFFLPPWVGLWRSVLLVASGLVVTGAWHVGQRTAGWFRPASAAACGAAVLWLALAGDWPRVRIAEADGERLVAVSEGAHGIVAVVERPGSRRLKLDNHYVLGGTGSSGDERMQAHLPLLLHPSPRQVVTASGAFFHPVDRLTLVELVPEVAAAARDHLREANLAVLEDGRTQLVLDDARSYLRGTATRFDVIVGDLVVPWRQGESALFTVEHLTAARRALAPRGLFCQWLPLFQLSEDERSIVLRTFLTVFPHAQLWRGDFSPDEPTVALVAGAEPVPLEPKEVEDRLRARRADPSNPHLAGPAAFWMYFVGVFDAKDLPPGDSRINREDHPWIELMGPMGHAGQGTARSAGRPLQAWLREVIRRSAGRVDGLGASERAGVEAGDALLEFSLSLAEKDEDAARAAQARLRGLLPEQTYRALFPEGPQGTGS